MGQRRKQATLKTRGLAVAALVAGTLIAGAGQAASFDVSDAVQHGDWQSVTLSRGVENAVEKGAEIKSGERHFRAVESTNYADATLSVNATPGVCDMPWLEMRVTLEGEEQTVATVPARLRVDDKTLHTAVAEFFTEPENNGFYAHFYLNDADSLLDDMHAGEQIFLGFEQGEDEPWYMIFSLDGADDAIGQTLQACRRASRP